MQNGERQSADLTLFVTYRTFFRPVCFHGAQRSGGGCLPVDKMPWHHSTTLHRQTSNAPNMTSQLSSSFVGFSSPVFDWQNAGQTTKLGSEGCFPTQSPLSLRPSPCQSNQCTSLNDFVSIPVGVKSEAISEYLNSFWSPLRRIAAVKTFGCVIS